MAKRIGAQLDLGRIPILGLVPESSGTSAPPADPVDGQLWYDTGEKRLKIRENGEWRHASNLNVLTWSQANEPYGYVQPEEDGKIGISMLPVGPFSWTVAAGDDPRFSDARPPSGTAGGDLAGSYPNPTIRDGAVDTGALADEAVTLDKVWANIVNGLPEMPSLRSLGSGSQNALAGDTRLDQLGSPTGPVSLNAQRITNVATPVNDTDGANKLYVDLARQGIRLKDAVRVATTAHIALSGTATIDGVAVGLGQRVLVKNQNSPSDNGIYVVSTDAWARATDADAATELNDGATTFVQDGATQANTTWTQVSALASLASPQSWVQQGAAVNYIAGAGLVQNGQTFDLVAADGSITVNADSITVGLVPVAKGGTGATTAAEARANLGVVGKYAANVSALTPGVETTITHNLGSTDVVASFKNAGRDEVLDWRAIDANTIGVTADLAYAANALRVTVVG